MRQEILLLVGRSFYINFCMFLGHNEDRRVIYSSSNVIKNGLIKRNVNGGDQASMGEEIMSTKHCRKS